MPRTAAHDVALLRGQAAPQSVPQTPLQQRRARQAARQGRRELFEDEAMAPAHPEDVPGDAGLRGEITLIVEKIATGEFRRDEGVSAIMEAVGNHD